MSRSITNTRCTIAIKMRKFSKDTKEQVVETLSSDSKDGLNAAQVASLRRAHGLNKLEEEQKVNNKIKILKNHDSNEWIFCRITL